MFHESLLESIYRMMDHMIQRIVVFVTQSLSTLLTICLMILSLNASFCQATSRKLPAPSQDQIKYNASKKGLAYLEGNFKKEGSRLNLKESIDCVDANKNNSCVCAWEQRFEGGIQYRYNECSGPVVEVTITFAAYDAKEIVRLVDILFKTDNNAWNHEKTEYKLKPDYEPKDGDLTCDYEIKQEKGKVVLICICGWW